MDDGSACAGCGEIFSRAQASGATVLHHSVSLGKGSALKTGFAYLQKFHPEIPGAITADANGQYSVKNIEKIADAMAGHPDAVILGTRDLSKMPLRMRAGNAVTRLAFRASASLRISDTQTGLRGLPASLFPKLLELAGERYEYEVNMLLALPAWQASFFEVKTDTVYIEGGSSARFHVLRDGSRVFSRVIRYIASSLVSTALDYTLYLILTSLGLNIALCFATAKTAGSVLNYELNCRTVFRARPSVKSMLGYAGLVGFSLLAGTPAVTLLIKAGFGKIVGKIIVDLTLFMFNFLMQKYIVFRKKDAKKKE